MHNAYQLGPWHDLYALLGSSAAPLAGLLFVAVSIQIGRIAKSPIFRARAWPTRSSSSCWWWMRHWCWPPRTQLLSELNCAFPPSCSSCFYSERWLVLCEPDFNCLGDLSFQLFSIWWVLRRESVWLCVEVVVYLVTLEFIAIVVWVMFGAWGLLLAIGEETPEQATN